MKVQEEAYKSIFSMTISKDDEFKKMVRLALNLILRFSFLIPIPILFSGQAKAALSLPSGLTEETRLGDRQTALEILGFGSTMKIVGDTYPLGGYSGVDVSIGREAISTGALASLGDPTKKTEFQKETSYYTFTFGKGFYQNIDLFVQLSPYGQGENISTFGGGGRWQFYELTRYPIYFSVQGVANSASFQNQINVSNQGLDFIGSIVGTGTTFYGGLGFVRTTGIFNEYITDAAPRVSTILSLSKFHAFIGAKYTISNQIYGAAHVDQTRDLNYSLRLGVRY